MNNNFGKKAKPNRRIRNYRKRAAFFEKLRNNPGNLPQGTSNDTSNVPTEKNIVKPAIIYKLVNNQYLPATTNQPGESSSGKIGKWVLLNEIPTTEDPDIELLEPAPSPINVIRPNLKIVQRKTTAQLNLEKTKEGQKPEQMQATKPLAPNKPVPNPAKSAQASGQPAPVPGKYAPPPGKTAPPPGKTAPVPGKSAPPPGKSVPAPGKSAPLLGKSAPAPGKSAPTTQQPALAPGQPRPTPSQPEKKPLMSVPKPMPAPVSSQSNAQGRMTASSFMNTSGMGHQRQGRSPAAAYPVPVYPAGIPRSFLAEQQRQMQEMATNAGSKQPNSQGPVWEVKVKPRWNSTDQTFDQKRQTNAYEQQMFVQTDSNDEQPVQQYSPSDIYSDMVINEENAEQQDDSVSQDSQQSGSKRLSAFKRLGPVTQAKKPKLTINLRFNKEEAVRKVVDQSEEDSESDKYTPAHLKAEVQTSLDDTVMKYLLCWPWKKHQSARRTVTARDSKSLMMQELEQMEEAYDRDSMFFQVSVTGYPGSWSKEDVLDTVLESVKGKSFIPCFVEFAKDECKFLVLRSRPALVAIHKYGFIINKEDVKLTLSIKQMSFGVQQIDFIPRLVLRKRLFMSTEETTELNLSSFTTTNDVSHFIYFPLNRVSNQAELIKIQSSVPWDSLTKLNLSHNRITSLSGFDLPHYTPRLKHLDLSHNYIEGISALLQCRELPLVTIALEGNPLCTDYIEQERYIKVLRMIFPGLKEIDGVKLTIPGTFPPWKRNYCPLEAQQNVEKVLEVLFPLLDSEQDERQRIEELYDVTAVMTVTFIYKLRYSPIYKDFRPLFSRARIMDEGYLDSIEGAPAIAKMIYRWPRLHHDPTTFTVDVMHHTEKTTILKVSGLVRVTTESLAEDEHLLSFTRTIVIHSLDSVEFKITNEMIYWDMPNTETAKESFRMTTGRNKTMSLKLEAPPNEDLKEKLLEIFMKLTEMERKPSERCLEMKDWHLKNALEYFSKLMKLDNFEPLLS